MKTHIKHLLVLLALLCLISATAAAYSVDEAEGTVVRVYKVGRITQEQTFEQDGVIFRIPKQSGAWIGTAFAVGDPGKPVQYFVTNNHVITDENECVIEAYDKSTGELLVQDSVSIQYDSIELYLVFEDKSTMVSASVVCSSEVPDLAVVSLASQTTKRTAAILRPFDINSMKKEKVYALGFPSAADVFLSDDAKDNLDSTQVTRTDGLISAFLPRSRSSSGELLQISAPINGGNSGGPLVDENGFVLGVNTMVAINAENVNAAVSVNEVIRMLDNAGISYTTVDSYSGGFFEDKTRIIILAIAGVVVLLAVVVLVRRKPKPPTPPQPQPILTRTLVCETGALEGKRFTIDGKAVIGRDPASCQIVFPSKVNGVSRVHCTLSIRGDKVYVTDNNSSYGTWIDNTKLIPGEKTVMHRGHRLYLGSRKQCFILRS